MPEPRREIFSDSRMQSRQLPRIGIRRDIKNQVHHRASIIIGPRGVLRTTPRSGTPEIEPDSKNGNPRSVAGFALRDRDPSRD